MEHGEIKIKKTKVGNNLVYTKRVQFCAVHGEIDLFVFPDFDACHGKCNQNESAHGVGLEFPATMKKAA